MLYFRMLGSLTVEVDGHRVTVAAPRQRVILAALLLNANRVVSVDRLEDFVWDNTPPSSGPAVIRTYVMRLRQALGSRAGARIVTRAPGYLVEVDDQETDLGRFDSHRENASALAMAGDLAGASAELSTALSIWQQSPLQDVQSSTLRDIEVRHLEERYFQTLSWRLDLDMQLGRHTDLVPELWRLTRENPLHEGLAAKLMLALFRSGRQSDALNVFHQIRAALIEELATEPGTELQQMQQQILASEDARLTGPGPAEVGPVTRIAPSPPRPAQLPAVLPDFLPCPSTGPQLSVDGLASVLSDPTAPPRAKTTVISGSGGVGKTSLAVHWAHACRKEYTRGQLYASLGGSSDRPVRPADLLIRFLRDLGVPQAIIPQDEAELEGVYRSVVADSKLLVVLDDAHSAAQVRPLIPGGARSRVLITSRNRLADLEGARTFVLGRMVEDSSLRLLSTIIGRARVDAELAAARQIVRFCSGLPLALRIVGIRLLSRPYRPLAGMADRLARADRLLDELSVGDLSVRSCFDTGYKALSAAPRHGIHAKLVLRILGPLETGVLNTAVLVERLGCSSIEAEDALDRLVDANLLEQDSSGRYLLSNLAQAYAREQSMALRKNAPRIA
ncbi:BTAD domain-containing putative transcriptional regulator [Streptomyces sp. TG1A-8]|uniref:AfsR/SARP family transcriptional regulator n=1 Tax=Streptomyces sp. TG1A-8 TaxID=3051385 RepID=UPI00265C5064|nr:BTAD domain-containing putative transcriptional regulator [Streptomyces sp. TG1A-8]MDO0923996.1 BTAD domain-containing putative transcriptional regulator [Streptomyces sp. TG1A-8]